MFEDGDQFSVWPIDDESFALEQEACTPLAMARTMFAQWRFDERDARHDDRGPTYMMRWR